MRVDITIPMLPGRMKIYQGGTAANWSGKVEKEDEINIELIKIKFICRMQWSKIRTLAA